MSKKAVHRTAFDNYTPTIYVRGIIMNTSHLRWLSVYIILEG